jgi:hypothetical protein
MTHTTYSSTKMMLIIGSVVAIAAFAMTSSASAWYYSSDDIDVRSGNSAVVVNDAIVTSNTGHNAVAGGDTRHAGSGGDARGGDATGGNGGNSGAAGDGGSITTGAAEAWGTINNDVNRNNTVVTTDCGCNGNGDVDVRSHNRANVVNWLGVDSNTGGNLVAGGTSGVGGEGGDAVARSSMWNYYYMTNTGTATGGEGGNSGSAGDGGAIRTGAAFSNGFVGNIVNRNVTRVQ